MPESTTPLNILVGYALRADFAEAVGVHPRTIDLWRSQPDGLPSVKIGNRVFIPIERGRAWLLRGESQPNQVRKDGRGGARLGAGRPRKHPESQLAAG